MSLKDAEYSLLETTEPPILSPPHGSGQSIDISPLPMRRKAIQTQLFLIQDALPYFFGKSQVSLFGGGTHPFDIHGPTLEQRDVQFGEIWVTPRECKRFETDWWEISKRAGMNRNHDIKFRFVLWGLLRGDSAHRRWFRTAINNGTCPTMRCASELKP